jgi:uncharacterized protein (DUF2267 family)
VKYDEFIKEVQTRGHMESRQEAEKATQATFRTLAERLAGDEPRNLASQLPPELAQHLPYEGEETSNPFSLEEFLKRVNEKDGGVDQPRAVYHARVVMEVLQEAVTEGRWTTSARSCRTSMPRSLRQPGGDVYLTIFSACVARAAVNIYPGPSRVVGRYLDAGYKSAESGMLSSQFYSRSCTHASEKAT